MPTLPSFRITQRNGVFTLRMNKRIVAYASSYADALVELAIEVAHLRAYHPRLQDQDDQGSAWQRCHP